MNLFKVFFRFCGKAVGTVLLPVLVGMGLILALAVRGLIFVGPFFIFGEPGSSIFIYFWLLASNVIFFYVGIVVAPHALKRMGIDCRQFPQLALRLAQMCTFYTPRGIKIASIIGCVMMTLPIK